MLYIGVGFFCMVIGYAIGIAHHVRELESEIKLRHEWEALAKGLVKAAAEYDGVAKNSTQQRDSKIADTLSCLCDKWGDYPESERQSLIVTVCQQLRQ